MLTCPELRVPPDSPAFALKRIRKFSCCGLFLAFIADEYVAHGIDLLLSYTSARWKRSKEADWRVRRLPGTNTYRKPITTFQTPAIDRLHGQLALPFGNHDSQAAVTLGTGALEILGHETTGPRRRYQCQHS